MLETIHTLFHDVIFENGIDIHQFIGIISLLVGIFGFYMAFNFRRSLQFRIKLALVYSFPTCSGLFGIILPPSEFHIVQHTLNVAFMFMASVLYWREVKILMTSRGYHRKSLGKYMDDIPDLVWIKDVDQKYAYVNKTMIDMLCLSEDDILGKTDAEIKATLDNNGIKNDFGEGIFATKHLSYASKPKIFIEKGYIGETSISLQVYKKPLFLLNTHESARRHIGYIGVARDLSYDVEDHELISKLIEEGELREALRIFELHKNRYDTEMVAFYS